MYLVYKAVSPSGKVYVGITSRSLAVRSGQHYQEARAAKRRGKSRYFYNALIKYGPAMQWEVLEDRLLGLSVASLREKHFIALLQANNPVFGYNGTEGGDAGAVPNGLVRAKQSQSAKARGMTAFQLLNLKKGRVSRPHTAHTKRKLSELLRGRYVPLAQRAAIASALSGKPKSPSHKQALRQAHARPVLRSDGRPFLSAHEAAIAMGAANPDAVGSALRRGTMCGGFQFTRLSVADYALALSVWETRLASGYVEQNPVWTKSRKGHQHTPRARGNMSRAWFRRGGWTQEHEARLQKARCRPVRTSDGRAFSSLGEAAIAFGVHRDAISYSIKTGGSRQGLTFHFTEREG